MVPRAEHRLWTWLLALVIAGPAAAAEVPEPLDLDSALGYAAEHPRVSAASEPLAGWDRSQPLYLGCHGLAYPRGGGVGDPRRNRTIERLITPLAAQQLAIMQRYFDVLLADLSYAAWNEAMAVAYVQFDRAGNREALGQTSELRVAELESEYLQVLRKRAASEAGQRLTRSLLAQAIGHPRKLSRDLVVVPLPRRFAVPTELEPVVTAAAAGNRWLAGQRQQAGEAGRELLDMALRQQVLELIMRLQVLETVARFAAGDMVYRDLRLEQSRVLYEQEEKADLGFSMSQQTRARLLEERVGYCRLLAAAELQALRGEPVWPVSSR